MALPLHTRLGLRQMPKVFATVDVGFNTGIAITREDEILYTYKITEKSEHEKQNIALRVGLMCEHFARILKDNDTITACFIEGVQMYNTSQVSKLAAASGDLFGLAYMAGAYCQVAMGFCNAYIVNPREWKGNMNKDITKSRIVRALGKSFGDHIDDAVGMSLSLRGKL